jgi:hypothetical protein
MFFRLSKKLEYIKEHKEKLGIDLDPNKIIKNEGLRFKSKICLYSLWGHFGMQEDFKKSLYISSPNEQIDIVFNDQYKDVSQIVLNEEFRLMEYKTKEEFRKPNKSTNIYIAIFTTAHARLRLYKYLEILDRRAMYCDSDSVIYIDDESEACKEIEKHKGNILGELTSEIGKNHITVHVAPAPKDYGCELDNGTVKMKTKGISMKANAEKNNFQ